MTARGEMARWFARARPWLVDIALTGSLMVVTVFLGHDSTDPAWRPFDATGYLLGMLVTLPTIVRRRAPMAVLVACCVFWAWYIWCGYHPGTTCFGPLLAVYTVGTLRSPKVTALGAGIAGSVWVYAQVRSGNGSLESAIGQAVVVPAVIARFGTDAAKLARRNGQLARLTEELRREQLDRARRAVTEERMRLARELHDVIAHHMAVVSVHAGLAGHLFPNDPAAARGAVDTIADASHEAQAELRRMLTVLRVGQYPAGDDPDTGPDAPVPGLDRIDDLVDRVRAAGVPVDVTVTGVARPLPPGLDLCVYRTIQESLTNVVKHAGTARVTVALHYNGDEFTVRIVDDGTGTARQPTVATQTGHGLVGMRERASLYGATLTAGPRPLGGFAVELTARVVEHRLDPAQLEG